MTTQNPGANARHSESSRTLSPEARRALAEAEARRQEYLAREAVSSLSRTGLRLLLPWLRNWDRQAARRRVDAFAAISTEIQRRIHDFYQRESTVIYPPVDTRRFQPSSNGTEDYFLVLSRLVPYKRIDLAVKAFNKLGLPLVVIGDGRDRPQVPNLVLQRQEPLADWQKKERDADGKRCNYN